MPEISIDNRTTKIIEVKSEGGHKVQIFLLNGGEQYEFNVLKDGKGFSYSFDENGKLTSTCGFELGYENPQNKKDTSNPSMTKENNDISFPDMQAIDSVVYKNIQKTCSERWAMGKMEMDTFSVKADHGEYVIKCNGIYEGKLRLCVIRADAHGKWINDGMEKIKP